MKVLLIEDNELLSSVLTDELKDAGHIVVQAFDGEEGLGKVKSEKPDSIILDLMMPKKSGLEVLKELRSDDETKDVPVLILTASENESKLDEALGLGATDAILKSRYTMEHIIERVGKISDSA